MPLNPDLKVKSAESLEQFTAALESGDTAKVMESLESYAQSKIDEVKADFDTAKVYDLSMEQLIANPKYNLRKLNADEKKFYQAVTITDNTFTNTPIPVSTFDRVFEDLRAEHPLLSLIQFVNTKGAIQWTMRDGDVAAAQWGKPCDEIKKQLDSAFKVENLGTNKLSAFVNLCKAMLEIGPEWLDRFVREMLAESMALGLEQAIVAGTGVDQPVGMTKDLSKPVDPVTGYVDKTPQVITDLTPKTIGNSIMAPMTNNGKVVVNPTNLLFIVNPLDYWTKLYSALAFRTPEGNYVFDRTSIGARIVQSTAIPQGRMLVGKAKDYFMGVSVAQKIAYSDEYRFLEDDRVYIVRMLAHGKPVSNTSFGLFDISGITGAPQA